MEAERNPEKPSVSVSRLCVHLHMHVQAPYSTHARCACLGNGGEEEGAEEKNLGGCIENPKFKASLGSTVNSGSE